MLYLIDLEPLEQRYTKQWSEWFIDAFTKQKIDFKVIQGTPKPFKTGQFLDVNRTNIYKAEQIIKVAELFDEGLVKNGDTFFIYDGWHYIVSAIRYMADLQDIKVKIYTYWHAGSYDPYDFLALKGTESWAKYLECSWLESSDKIFVATDYHKTLLLNTRIRTPNKIKVVGFPFDLTIFDKYKIDEKEDIIVFPHRIAPEKQPEYFDLLSNLITKYKWIKTIDVTKNKDEYYKLLAKAKIVFSANLQETFGIGTMEATMLGCIPLVPDRLSYREIYDDFFRYKDERELLDKLNTFMNNYYEYKNLDRYLDTTDKLKTITDISNLIEEVIN